MPIRVECTCGKRFRAVDRLAGKRVKCPACGAALPNEEPFMDADRKYFEDHPEATSYDRLSFPEEHPYSCVGPHLVTVREITPGLRMREARPLHFYRTTTPRAEA